VILHGGKKEAPPNKKHAQKKQKNIANMWGICDNTVRASTATVRRCAARRKSDDETQIL